MSDWTRRPYNAEWDRDAVTYLWIRSHAIQGARGRRLRRLLDTDENFRAHIPAVHWILEHASTTVLCDPERAEMSEQGPPIIYAFATVTDDPALLHYVAVKNTVIDKNDYALAAEMVQELTATLRSGEVVGVTQEIPLLNRPEMRALNAGRGERWYMDDTYFARMFGEQQKRSA